MKINNTSDTFVETSGLTDTGAFTIKQSPKAFQILSSGLYSNKLLAIVRELTCNAYDAHVMAGRKDTPIEVKLPNKLDTQFYVKDFGPGLSHEQVMRLYTTYFDSTKTNSNDFIGGLGLGSKSPFSYTDSFTVESRQNGIAKTYGAFVNDDGIPTIALMTEQPTTEGDGLTVGFPVKPEDYDGFSYEAKTFLRWMQPAPVLKGANLAGPPTPIVTCKGLDVLQAYPGPDDNSGSSHGNGRLRPQAKTGTWVRMGQVNYPVDWHAADLAEDPLAQLLIRGSRAYVLHAPIGSLNVAASREGLQYDKQGKREITNLLKTFAGNLIDYLNNENADVTTNHNGFGAGTHIRKITSNWGFDIFDPTVLENLETVSGKKLNGLRETLFVEFPSTMFKTFHLDYFTSSSVSSDSSRRFWLSSGRGHGIDHRYKTMVIECDTRGYLRAISELQSAPKLEPYYAETSSTHSLTRSYDRTLVIVPKSSKVRDTDEYKEEVKAFLKIIGNPFLRHTSEYVNPAKNKFANNRQSGADSVLAYPVNHNGVEHSAYTFQDSNKFAWFPVDVGSNSVFLYGHRVDRYWADKFFQYLHKTAQQYGVVLPPIAAVSKTYQRRVETFTNAVHFDTVLDDFFEHSAIMAALQNPLYVVVPEHNGFDHLAKLRSMLSHLDQTAVEVVKPLKEISLQQTMGQTQDSLARLVITMHKFLGKGPRASLRQLDPAKTYESFCLAFPLFSILTKHVTETDFQKQEQLRIDLTRYLQDRKNENFTVSWTETDYL